MAESISTEHCFHTNSPMKWPAKFTPVICCYCGLGALRTTTRIKPPGHGLFSPKELLSYEYHEAGANDGCPKALQYKDSGLFEEQSTR